MFIPIWVIVVSVVIFVLVIMFLAVMLDISQKSVGYTNDVVKAQQEYISSLEFSKCAALELVLLYHDFLKKLRYDYINQEVSSYTVVVALMNFIEGKNEEVYDKYREIVREYRERTGNQNVHKEESPSSLQSHS